MKTYLFYTFEGACESPNESNVENMQILGQASGKDFLEAFSNLIKENQWITKKSFNVDKILAKQIVDDELKSNIQQIVNYLWNDEKRHYEESPCKNHIFMTLKELKKAID